MSLGRGEASQDTTGDSSRGGEVDLTGIDNLLAGVLRVPAWWVVLVIGFAVASTISVSRDTSGVYSIEFGVSWITAVAVALLWLPAFLRVTSLAGGGMKASASGVEAWINSQNTLAWASVPE